MQQVELRHETEILSENELKLLAIIRDHIDGSNGYFPALQAGPALLEANYTTVQGYLRTLLTRELIAPTPGLNYTAFDITKKGRAYLHERGFAEQSNWTMGQAIKWLFNEKLSPILVRLLGLNHLAE